MTSPLFENSDILIDLRQTRSMLRFLYCMAAFMVVSVLCVSSQAQQTQDAKALERAKDDLIRNLTAAELLYENLDVVVERSLTLVNKGSLSDEELNEFNVIRNETRKMEFISQHGLIFNQVEIERTSFGIDGLQKITSRDGYDGERTIVYSPPIVNIVEGPVEGIQRFRPHSLPLASISGLPHRMSTILDGSCRQCITSSDRQIEIRSIENIQREDGDFVRLRLDFVEPKSQRPLVGWWELDFSPHHNYLIIRGNGYAADYTNSFPLEEVEIQEFKELETGVFFPYKFVSKVYNSGHARRGIRTLSNVTTWDFKRASLNPYYPKSKFSDISYPADATVSYIRDGKIIKTEAPGRPDTAPAEEH